tara:strand:- start:1505 stop:1855 length:351 start_codon:yes stop_codon:yes gene_type:complete
MVFKQIENKMKATYPRMIKRFTEIQREQYELFLRKQHDYGSNNISLGGNLDLEEDRKLSLQALSIRMNDKANRLITILFRNKGNNAVKSETYLDAFKDTSVYGIIAQLVDEGKWGK